LRINGPVTQVVPRICTEDTVLSDTFIPKGTAITVDVYNLHHNDKIWKDSFQFNPDRFKDNGEAENQGSGFSWIPFGNGPRQCIGMNFSLAEQRVLLSMMCKYINYHRIGC
jgi:cytochrome P450